MQSNELQSTAKSSIARVTGGHGPLNHRCHNSTTMCASRVALHQKASMSLFNRLCSTTIHIIDSMIYVMRMRPWFKQAVKHYYPYNCFYDICDAYAYASMVQAGREALLFTSI